jgi:hypothetical protein
LTHRGAPNFNCVYYVIGAKKERKGGIEHSNTRQVKKDKSSEEKTIA